MDLLLCLSEPWQVAIAEAKTSLIKEALTVKHEVNEEGYQSVLKSIVNAVSERIKAGAQTFERSPEFCQISMTLQDI